MRATIFAAVLAGMPAPHADAGAALSVRTLIERTTRLMRPPSRPSSPPAARGIVPDERQLRQLLLRVAGHEARDDQAVRRQIAAELGEDAVQWLDEQAAAAANDPRAERELPRSVADRLRQIAASLRWGDSEETPDAGALMARATQIGLDHRALGELIQGPTALQDLGGVRARFESAGLLGAREHRLPEGRVRFREAAQRLWFETAEQTPRLHPLDSRWAIPSTVVESDGIAFHIHDAGHNPGLDWPAAHRAQIRSLVAQLRRERLPLLSEQRLPAAYGFGYGLEVIDDPPGAQPTLRPAARDWAVTMTHSAWNAATGLTLLLPTALVWQWPERPAAWLLAGAGVAAAYLINEGFRPLRRAAFLARTLVLEPLRRSGAAATWQFLTSGDDTAHHYWQYARALFARHIDPKRLRRVRLPMAPAGYWAAPSSYPRRAADIARLAREAARRNDWRELHILAGHEHADETAGHLSSPR